MLLVYSDTTREDTIWVFGYLRREFWPNYSLQGEQAFICCNLGCHNAKASATLVLSRKSWIERQLRNNENTMSWIPTATFHPGCDGWNLLVIHLLPTIVLPFSSKRARPGFDINFHQRALWHLILDSHNRWSPCTASFTDSNACLVCQFRPTLRNWFSNYQDEGAVFLFIFYQT